MKYSLVKKDRCDMDSHVSDLRHQWVIGIGVSQ